MQIIPRKINLSQEKFPRRQFLKESLMQPFMTKGILSPLLLSSSTKAKEKYVETGFPFYAAAVGLIPIRIRLHDVVHQMIMIMTMIIEVTTTIFHEARKPS